VLAGGVTHDARIFRPFPIFVERTAGPWKWTPDGRRLVDYWMGHGSLILGHSHPDIVRALKRQAGRMMHPGACHKQETLWAEWVCRLVPSAQRVRFTSSGTEAVMLAIRVSRAVTGRSTVMVLDGHFHGWGDETIAHFVDLKAAGIPARARSLVTVVDPFDKEAIIARLERRNVAAVLLEPGGGGSGALPCDIPLLEGLLRVTRETGTLLVFDETISGFRAAPGGVQQRAGVLPDLTILGKILCGGLPGGAIVGLADIMDGFGTGTSASPSRRIRIPHTGTFNANPLSAAAGTATLERVSSGAPQLAAATAAEMLVSEVNRAAARMGVDVFLYTDGGSVFHVQIGALSNRVPTGPSAHTFRLYASHPEKYSTLRMALLLEGVDCHPLHGWVSAAHDRETILETVAAFERAFGRVADEWSSENEGP
jgi:glutamate-1-semialdehyde 2,1-aminomutase